MPNGTSLEVPPCSPGPSRLDVCRRTQKSNQIKSNQIKSNQSYQIKPCSCHRQAAHQSLNLLYPTSQKLSNRISRIASLRNHPQHHVSHSTLASCITVAPCPMASPWTQASSGHRPATIAPPPFRPDSHSGPTSSSAPSASRRHPLHRNDTVPITPASTALPGPIPTVLAPLPTSSY